MDDNLVQLNEWKTEIILGCKVCYKTVNDNLESRKELGSQLLFLWSFFEVAFLLSKGNSQIWFSQLVIWKESLLKENKNFKLIIVLILYPCSLDSCKLTPDMCGLVAKGLSQNFSLKELNMSNNSLKDEGVRLLCLGLQDGSCALKTLR